MTQWQLQQPMVVEWCRGRCPVQVANEWDPLQEVIVGVLDDPRVPEWDPALAAVLPPESRQVMQQWVAHRFPRELLDAARKELDGLADFLAKEGVTVRRPDEVDHHHPIVTPHFSTEGGFYAAMPRDGLLAINDTIVETPMSWRSRYFEAFAFRSVLTDYFQRGARWLAGPKPQLREEVWTTQCSADSRRFSSAIGEHEPLLDAADFVRIGNNTLVGQLSHVTNQMGVQWLRRSLGPEYRVLVYDFEDMDRMHIDVTILPLAEGRVLVNPAQVARLPDVFADWEVLLAPPTQLPADHLLVFSHRWIHCNVLMLDPRHVLVDTDEHDLAEAFRHWGITPIGLPFKHVQTFGGSFHCTTLDIRRG